MLRFSPISIASGWGNNAQADAWRVLEFLSKYFIIALEWLFNIPLCVIPGIN